jgi:acetyltransferase-like isoleucine patch superfamily enzyme
VRVILAIIGLSRDLIKDLYLFVLQICTRLFYIHREFPSSISLHSRLDVIPRDPEHRSHKLSLGKYAHIEKWSVVNTWFGDVILSEGASVGIGSIVIGPVRFGKKSVCSQNCFITGESHLYKDINTNFLSQDYKIQEVVFGDNVWVGSNCVILPGVTIGNNSVIGAGSVVTKSVPSFSMAVGNPAKVITQYNPEVGEWVRL